MRLYASKNANSKNGELFDPERVAEAICLNPHYRWAVVDPQYPVRVLMDSGAFQDRGETGRLTFQQALDRQLEYVDRLPTVHTFEIVAYDRIEDMDVTIEANTFLAYHAPAGHLPVFVTQGTAAAEYLRVLDHVKTLTPNPVVGIGGVAPAGRVKVVAEKLYAVCELFAYHLEGIPRVHLFGVGSLKVLRRAHALLRSQGWQGEITCDTSRFERAGGFGNRLMPDGTWQAIYQRRKAAKVPFSRNEVSLSNIQTAVTLLHAIEGPQRLPAAA